MILSVTVLAIGPDLSFTVTATVELPYKLKACNRMAELMLLLGIPLPRQTPGCITAYAHNVIKVLLG